VTTDSRNSSDRNRDEKQNAMIPRTQKLLGQSFKIISFDELAEGNTEIWIELDQQYYRLSRTRSGKLVLTK
jgi:hemin uptake protein HemP